MRNINTSKGYFRVYWELLDDDNLEYQSVFFLGYLTHIFKILRQSTWIDGEEYKRLADSFIQEKIPVSSPTIKKWLDELEREGYIEIYHKDNKKNGIRYYKLNKEYYDNYFNEIETYY